MEDDGHVARLNALVNPVGNTLHATNPIVLASALRSMSDLVKLDLPELSGAAANLITQQMLTIIKKNGGLSSELSQSALKSVSTIMREQPGIKLSTQDLSYLMTLVQADLEEPEIQSGLFALLRALLGRQAMDSSVYDAMDKVANVMVTNQSGQVREVCRSLYLQFLLDCPQGEKRVRNQLQFLASNLSYKFESGRLSVLELLRAVLAKFNTATIQLFSDALFVSLVMVMANDESPDCRTKAATVLRSLLNVCDDQTTDRNLQLIKGWASSSSKARLCKVGFQMLSISLESTSSRAGSDTTALAKKTIIELAAAAREHGEASEACSGSLSLLHRLLERSNGFASWQEVLGDGTLWSAILVVATSERRATRSESISLIADVLARVKFSDQQLIQPVSDAVSASLRASLLEDTLEADAGRLEALLVNAGLALRSMSPAAVGGPEDSEETGDNEDDEEDEEETEKKGPRQPLSWWFSRISFTLRGRLSAWPRFASNKVRCRASVSGANLTCSLQVALSRQMVLLMNCFSKIAEELDVDQLSIYLTHMLNPLSRALDDVVFPLAADDEIGGTCFLLPIWATADYLALTLATVRTTAESLSNKIRDKVGSTAYAQAFNAVRQKAVEKRKQRRNNILMQDVSNPDAAYRRKTAKTASKHTARKRKAQHFRENKLHTKAVKHHKL